MTKYNYSEWSKESLEKLFGEGYVIEPTSFSNQCSRDFVVKKLNQSSRKISYSKHRISDAEGDYVIGTAYTGARVHKIDCYGSKKLKEVHSDAEMVEQAKLVLEC